METKKLKGISQATDISTYWKHKILSLVGTEFEIDNSSCFSKKYNQFFPISWLVFDDELEDMIKQRQDLSGQIETLDIERYFEEVKNDVLNLDDRYKARLGEWLCEHLDIEVTKDDEWNNDN
jgi:hypothetical protein